MTVNVLLELKIKPESVEDAKKLFEEILPDTRSYEGCEKITLCANDDEPENIMVFEYWQTRPHYEKYLAWRTETGVVDKIVAMSAEPPSIKYFNDTGI